MVSCEKYIKIRYLPNTTFEQFLCVFVLFRMFSGWFKEDVSKIGFEDVLFAIQNPEKHVIINTLPSDCQDCLIKTTLPSDIEERILNDFLARYQQHEKRILIYGKNTTDMSVERKYKQLRTLGFSEVYIFHGGLFEWVLLQDIYGEAEFPTTKTVLDILKFKPPSMFKHPRLTY